MYVASFSYSITHRYLDTDKDPDTDTHLSVARSVANNVLFIFSILYHTQMYRHTDIQTQTQTQTQIHT